VFPLTHPWSAPGEVLSRPPVPPHADFFTAVFLTCSSAWPRAAADSPKTVPGTTSTLGPLMEKHQARILEPTCLRVTQSTVQIPLLREKQDACSNVVPRYHFWLVTAERQSVLWKACGQNENPLSSVTAKHVAWQFAVNRGQSRATEGRVTREL